jgi:branched-chain amino acid transport system substrate-binding protein
VIADYGVNTLGKKKWAIVHSTDAYGTSGEIGWALDGAGKSFRRNEGQLVIAAELSQVLVAEDRRVLAKVEISRLRA